VDADFCRLGQLDRDLSENRGAVEVRDAQAQVFVGVDVGKSEHHAVALDADGRVLLDRALPQDETALRTLIGDLRRRGTVLFVVDQPATIGALPLAVARDEGVRVGYLPGRAMRRIAEIHAGEAKTDARDAAVIAQAARSLPHALRPLRQDDEATATLAMLAGFDEDLARQVNQLSNRVRGLLTQVHPALERVLGPRLQHPAALDLLQRYPSPSALRAAGRARVAARLRRRAPRLGDTLAKDIFAALEEQSVVVTGTDAAARVLPELAEQLMLVLAQRQRVADQLEDLVEEHELGARLLTMPGVGFLTAANVVAETAGRHFATPGHLAAFAGLAPVTHRSGTSIRGERAPRRGNRRLKRALYLSAFAALKDPVSRAYYDRKRAENKSHQGALLALARRRSDVLFAMFRDGTAYDPLRALAA
jgi:transposase